MKLGCPCSRQPISGTVSLLHRITKIITPRETDKLAQLRADLIRYDKRTGKI
jgi:hypothetical protein